MATNRQFALAVHILTMLAGADSTCLSSDAMARSANANAVSIRRALTRFRHAGFVTSRPGSRGGTQPARDPAEITLADVWRIVYGDDPILGLYDGDPGCPVGSRVHPLLLDIDADARRALQAELSRTTIADVAAEMAERIEAAAVADGH